jgi:hypothetical protein
MEPRADLKQGSTIANETNRPEIVFRNTRTAVVELIQISKFFPASVQTCIRPFEKTMMGLDMGRGKEVTGGERIDHRKKDCRRQPEGCSEGKSTGIERVK